MTRFEWCCRKWPQTKMSKRSASFTRTTNLDWKCCVGQKPVRRGTGEGEDEGRADDAPPGPRMDEGEDEGGAASGEEPGEADPAAPSRTKLRTRTIVRPSLREKFDAAFSVYLYEDPEFMRVRADVQAGLDLDTPVTRALKEMFIECAQV